MKTSKKTFDIPYLGYDYGKPNLWNFDVLVGQFGNPIIGIKIKNIVEQYSADPEAYLQFHTILNQVVSIIGENHIVQKLDIFTRKKYTAEDSEEFLQKKYSEHFDGRLFKSIDTILLFTNIVDAKKKKPFQFSKINYKILRDKCLKIFMLLSQNHTNPEFLWEKDFEFYLGGIISMNFSNLPSFDNIKVNKDHIVIGNKYIKTTTFVDVEKIELPSEIETYSLLGGNSSTKDTAVDNFSFINELEDYSIIVFNQVISIPHQASRQRELEKKQKRHEGAANNSPANIIVADEIKVLLHNIASDGQLIVDAHFSLSYATNSMAKLEEIQSSIENKLFMKGIIVSQNAHNQLELFRCCIPGNSVELKDYDLFTTTSEAALCFFFKESFSVNEESNFFLRFTDRQGVPLKIDVADLPVTTGRINNRNKFVLGPSGSGKSFLMNNIVEQYLTYNYDIIIVDTGDSYSSLCAYKGGRYIKYTEQDPITMNPFLIKENEFNIEKTEFLSNLIFLIWEGSEKSPTNVQKSIIDNALMSYYHQYFKGGTSWYNEKESTELFSYLSKYNIHEDDIIREIENDLKENKSYYDILEIPFDASNEDIRTKGRKLIAEFHPDKNINNPDYDSTSYFKIYEAYDTLSDENKRKIYNETQLIIIKSNDIIKKRTNTADWNESIRTALIKRIVEIEEHLAVPDLSFNSFYDYCGKFLPLYVNNRNHIIANAEFKLSNFFLVLKDFYKGGRYETTLNQNSDDSLFFETFIVFEIDNVKDNPTLFPIITLIIMDTFMQKMRLKDDFRKALIIEEAWKAIASKQMGGYLKYVFKTVRKFWGEAIVVTQELDDIIGNKIVKDAIINNSDTFILLDQTKFKDNFSTISSILSLNKVEQNKIFTINHLENKFGRNKFKEFYLKRGSKGEVYGNEVSTEQYLTYTTEKPEKIAFQYYVKEVKNYDQAINLFMEHFKTLDDKMPNMCGLINLYKQQLDIYVIDYYKKTKKKTKETNILKILNKELLETKVSLKELIKSKYHEYEKV